MRPVAVGEYCALNETYTFDRFVCGEQNLLTVTASQAVAQTPAEVYNPLFIHGKSGLGKTHLLHAIGNHIRDHEPWMKVVYITSERFTNELVDAIRDKTTEAFRNRYRQADVLLIDDIHFLKDRTWTQEELFHTFNELYERKKQIVLSSDRSPEELSKLQDRLVSRFHWGLVTGVQPPAYKTRLAILRKKAAENQLQVDQAVIDLIAKRVQDNVRALEGALIKVAAHLDLYQNLTMDAIGELLPSGAQPVLLTVEQIKSEVARHYHVTVGDIEGESRVKGVAQARQMAIFLAREHTNSSFPALGQQFGNRNHSTIMHAYKKAKSLVETPLFRHELEEIRATLLEQAD